MAASMKRKHVECASTEEVKRKVIENTVLEHFLSWCTKHEFQVSSKVTVKREGSCAQYGMQAAEDIAEGYLLFQIPRSMLLMPENSDIADLIETEKEKLTATNQWIPLLLTLLYESNKADKGDSKWAPYLAIAPDPDAIDLPMFWDKEDVDQLLKGTGADKAVSRDLLMIESDLENLVMPFVKKYKNKLGFDNVTLASFKRMVAFVMAYSFTEPAGKIDDEDDESDDEEEEGMMMPPMMVPLADSLNHITRNNAKLTFGGEALKMVATREIKKGEEIFNTYGQVSNLHLMHMYGFAEPFPDNTNDVVEIPCSHLLSAASELGLVKVKDKWATLLEQDVISEDDCLVLGCEGIINDDICSQVLKVMCMSEPEYQQYVENEGWSDDGEDTCCGGEESALQLDKCSQLTKSQKLLLKHTCERHLQQYPAQLPESLQEAQTVFSSSSTPLTARQRYALYTNHGQQILLRNLISECSEKSQ